ncbi:MAG: DUF45 domain-containing protein [Planctomycetaceae bacterium]|nr:DUF45 domain-containing protein [Planctomycetaceae bacterium]
MADLPYLAGYPEETLDEVRALVARGQLGAHVAKRYPGRHPYTTNKLLQGYVSELRQRHMKTAPAVARVTYDDHVVAVRDALGLHTFESRVHGSRLRARSEMRIAGLFRDAAPQFLRMIVVHELAHLRERDHNKAFYRLCEAMEPNYHQYEFDLRLLLTARELEGQAADQPADQRDDPDSDARANHPDQEERRRADRSRRGRRGRG